MIVKKFKIGWLGSGGKLTIDDKGFLNYSSPYGKTFRVKLEDIETVSLGAGYGSVDLKIIGSGTELASIKLPVSWAQKMQEWIIEQLDK